MHYLTVPYVSTAPAFQQPSVRERLAERAHKPMMSAYGIITFHERVLHDAVFEGTGTMLLEAIVLACMASAMEAPVLCQKLRIKFDILWKLLPGMNGMGAMFHQELCATAA